MIKNAQEVLYVHWLYFFFDQTGVKLIYHVVDVGSYVFHFCLNWEVFICALINWICWKAARIFDLSTVFVFFWFILNILVLNKLWERIVIFNSIKISNSSSQWSIRNVTDFRRFKILFTFILYAWCLTNIIPWYFSLHKVFIWTFKSFQLNIT